MTVRRFHPADVHGVIQLHGSVWWPERSPEGWRWLDDNPARRALDAPDGWVIDNADGDPAAFLGNFIQRFWREGRPLYGATGISVIVPSDQKGRSRDLITPSSGNPAASRATRLTPTPDPALCISASAWSPGRPLPTR